MPLQNLYAVFDSQQAPIDRVQALTVILERAPVVFQNARVVVQNARVVVQDASVFRQCDLYTVEPLANRVAEVEQGVHDVPGCRIVRHNRCYRPRRESSCIMPERVLLRRRPFR